MTDPAVLADLVAVVMPSGDAVTDHCRAGAWGVEIGPGATADELGMIALATDPGAEAATFRRWDIAAYLQAQHGDGWIEHVPTRPDGTHAATPKTWRNAATDGAVWTEASRRRDMAARGITAGHLSALTAVQRDDPASAEEWIDLASAGGWSVATLRRSLRGARFGNTKPAAPDPATRSEAAVRAIETWLEDEGLTLFSGVQVAHLASAVLEAVDRLG